MSLPAGRPALGGVRTRCPFVCAADGLFRDASSVPSKAAKSFTAAVGYLAEGNVGQKTFFDSAEKALVECRSAGSADGEKGAADALTLIISGLAAKAYCEGALPSEAFTRAKSELSGVSGRFGACMKLAIAEIGGYLATKSESFEEALEYANEALSTFQDVKDKAMEAVAQLVLSGLDCKRQRVAESHQAASAALALFNEVGNKAGQAKAYHALAQSYYIPGDYDGAVSSAKKAAALYKELGLKRHLALELQCITQWHMRQDKPQRGLRTARDSLTAARDLKGSRKTEAMSLLLLAEAFVADGYGKRGLKVVQEGLAKLRNDGDAEGIACGLIALLHTHLLLASPGEALEAALEAKSYAKTKHMELDLLHSKSKALLASGETSLAATALRDAAAIAKDSLDDNAELVEALRALALAYAGDASTMNLAMEAAAEARSTSQGAEDAVAEAMSAMLCASLLIKSGASADEVLGEAEEARLLYQEAEDVIGEAASLKVIIDCNVAKKDYDEAMEAASDCMELYAQLGKKKEQAEAMCSIANINLQLDYADDAIEVVDEAVALAQEVGAKALEARLNLVMAQVLVTTMSQAELPADKTAAMPEDFLAVREKATKATKDALDLAGKCGDKKVRASALFWRSEVLVWTFRGGEALLSAQEAEQQFAKCEDTRGQAHSKVLMADLSLMMGSKEEAKSLSEDALQMVQGVRGCEDVASAANAVLERANKKEAAPVVAAVAAVAGDAPVAAAAAATEVAKPKMSKDVVLKKVLELANNVVAGGDDEDVAQDVPFMEAGIDSLGSVQFVTDVGKEFGMNLPPSAIFDFPTGRALVDHLIDELS